MTRVKVCNDSFNVGNSHLNTNSTIMSEGAYGQFSFCSFLWRFIVSILLFGLWGWLYLSRTLKEKKNLKFKSVIESDIRELLKNLASQKDDINSLSQDTKELQAEFSSKEREVRELLRVIERYLSSKENNIKALKQDIYENILDINIIEMEKEILYKEKVVDCLQQDIYAFYMQLLSKEEDIVRLKKDITELQAEFSTKEREIRELQEQFSLKEQKISILLENPTYKGIDLSSLAQYISALQKQDISPLQRELIDLQLQSPKETDISPLQQEIRNLQLCLSLKDTDINPLKQEIINLKSQLSSSRP